MSTLRFQPILESFEVRLAPAALSTSALGWATMQGVIVPTSPPPTPTTPTTPTVPPPPPPSTGGM